MGLLYVARVPGGKNFAAPVHRGPPDARRIDTPTAGAHHRAPAAKPCSRAAPSARASRIRGSARLIEDRRSTAPAGGTGPPRR